MKCKYCKKEKRESDFQICSVIKGKTYRRKKCTSCKIKTQKQRSKLIKEELLTYKKLLVCSTCGFSDYRAIVYHHTNPDEKDINITDAIRKGWSFKRVLSEIEKCIPLCANCHSILHHEERNKPR